MGKMSRLPLFLFILSCVLSGAAANCKMHDAKWKAGNAGPRVSQPSAASEPLKVLVDWSGMLDNARCVDGFNLHFWPTGKDRQRFSRTVSVSPATATSTMLTLPAACQSYDVVVESVEEETFSTDRRETRAATFAAKSEPRVMRDIRKQKRLFEVDYARTSTSAGPDLRRATVRFPIHRVADRADCLDRVELVETVSPEPVMTMEAVAFNPTAVAEEPTFPEYPRYTMPVRPASAAAGGTRGRMRRSSVPPRRPQRQQLGGAGSSSSSGRVAETKILATARPPFAPGQDAMLELQGELSQPCHPGATLAVRFYGKNKQTVGVKKAPSTSSAPGVAVLGEVSGLRPPPLAAVDGFAPPADLAAMLYKMRMQSGTSPAVSSVTPGVLPSTGSIPPPRTPFSPIPHSCLHQVLQAVDLERSRTRQERDANKLSAESYREYGEQMRRAALAARRLLLRKSGCSCAEGTDGEFFLTVTSTDEKARGRFGESLGRFAFDGREANGRPVYRKLPVADKKAKPASEDRFLYFDSDGRWKLGTTDDGRSGSTHFRSSQLEAAKRASSCPFDADLGWEYSGTIRWKEQQGLKVACN